MKFQSPDRRPPPNYFSGREQMRLLSLTALLILVFVLMRVAGKPSTWSWLWRIAPATVDSPDSAVPLAAVKSPASEPNLGSYDGLLPGIDPEQLKIVRDNTFFRSAEDEIFYDWLANLRQIPGAELPNYAVGRVGFRQLLQQMPEYRGRIVLVEGIIRRCHFIAAPLNSQEIAGYWRCWLFVDEKSTPIVIYSLNVPEDFPTGMEIAEPAKVYGLAFKRWAFEAASDTSVAPLLLARSVERLSTVDSAAPARKKPPPLGWFTVLSVLVLSVGLAILAFWGTRGSAAKRRGRSGVVPDSVPATEFLQSLAEEPRSKSDGELPGEENENSSSRDLPNGND